VLALTRIEAAQRLRVSLRTLDRLLAEGCLPRVRLGRRVVVLEGDLEALLKTSKEDCLQARDSNSNSR